MRRDFIALGLVLLLTVGCGFTVTVVLPATTAVGVHAKGPSLALVHDGGHAVRAKNPPYVRVAQHPDTAVPSFDYGAVDLSHEPDLGLHAKAAMLVDLDAGAVLWARNTHLQRTPASLAKLMTAVVALQNATPKTPIIVTAVAADAEPSRMGLSEGELITVQDALYGMLLPSGNDAAEALATGLMPRNGFLALMNREAARLTMNDTHFTTPSGLDTPGTHTSVADLAVLAAYVIAAYPEITAIASLHGYNISATDTHKAYFLASANHFLDVYSGASGLKTGYTGDAGGCIIATVTRGERHLMVVLMGSDIMYGDAVHLFDYGFSGAAQTMGSRPPTIAS